MSRFVVVTGLPASGKSTVAVAVAKRLRLPLLDKDEILEALFDSLGVGSGEWRRQLSGTADLVLQQRSMQTRGAVLVSWWRHPESAVASGTSPSWLQSLPGEIIELHCGCGRGVAAERFARRRRHPGHLDAQPEGERLQKFEGFVWPGALGIGRLVELNIEQPVDLEALFERLEAPAGNPSTEPTVAGKPPVASHAPCQARPSAGGEPCRSEH